MKHTPLSDEQIAAQGLLDDGIYDFEIITAEDKISPKGNEMLEVKLNVFDTDGSIRPMRDWILPQMAKKFKHFHNACGMMDKYESGSLIAADVIGKSGKCLIKTAPYTNKHGDEVMGNKVEDYVKRDNLEVYNKAATLPKSVESDDIPF